MCQVLMHSLARTESLAPVAQRIERQPPELDAVGSNPAGRVLFTSRDLKAERPLRSVK